MCLSHLAEKVTSPKPQWGLAQVPQISAVLCAQQQCIQIWIMVLGCIMAVPNGEWESWEQSNLVLPAVVAVSWVVASYYDIRNLCLHAKFLPYLAVVKTTYFAWIKYPFWQYISVIYVIRLIYHIRHKIDLHFLFLENSFLCPLKQNSQTYPLKNSKISKINGWKGEPVNKRQVSWLRKDFILTVNKVHEHQQRKERREKGREGKNL